MQHRDTYITRKRPRIVFAGIVLIFGLAVVPLGGARGDDTVPLGGIRGGDTVLTLRAAVERALEANHGVARARAEVAASEATVRLGRSLVLPTVEVSGRGTRNDPEVKFADGTVTLLPLNDWDLQLRVTQPIYAGFQDLKVLRQSKIGVDSARLDVKRTTEALLLRLAGNYLDALRGEALIEVEEKSVELATRRLRRSEAFYEAGEVTPVDVLRARAAVKAAERRLAGARQIREAALSRLRVDLVLDGDFTLERPENLFPPLPDEEELLDRALARRPELARAANDVAVAGLEIERVRAQRQPDIDAEAVWIRQQSNFPTNEFRSLSVLVKVPIFQGGAVAAEVAVAEERRRQADLGLDELRLAVREALYRVLLDLETAELQLSLAEEELVAVEAEYQGVNNAYEALEATSLDVDISELSLAAARRTVIDSTLDRAFAQLRVWHGVGDLESVLLGEEMP